MTSPAHDLTASRFPREKPLDFADRMRRRAELAERRAQVAERKLADAATAAAAVATVPPLLLEVLEHHAARLRENAAANYDAAAFVSGIAWALWALERARLAAHGVTDRERLGLDVRPSTWSQKDPPRPRI